MHVLLYTILVIGVLIVIISLLMKPSTPITTTSEVHTINTNDNSILKESKEVLEEFQQYSSYVITECETKHKELLYLYEIIDKKQNELKALSSSVQQVAPMRDVIQPPVQELNKGKISQKNKEAKGVENEDALQNYLEEYFRTQQNSEGASSAIETMVLPESEKEMTKSQKVIHKYKQGKSISEIADELQIGKGEVSLIIQIMLKGDN